MVKRVFDAGYCTSEEIKDAGFLSVGENVLIARNCTIVGIEKISIGDNVRIDSYTTLVASGDGYIRLGSHIHIGAYTLIQGSGGVVMEDFSGFSHGVRVFTMDDDYTGQYMTNPTIPVEFRSVKTGAVHVGRHGGTGSGTTVLPGVSIGEGAVAGAHSMVTKDMQPWGIYFGVPAKMIRPRSKNLLDLEKKFLEQYHANKPTRPTLFQTEDDE